MTEDYSLPNGWFLTKLAVLVCDNVTKGSTPTSYGFAYQDSGIKFIKTENINLNGEIEDVTAHIDENANEFLKRSILQPSDILFSIAGTIGRVGIIKEKDVPANTNQALAIIRCDWDIVSNKFLFYLLKSPFIQKQAEDMTVGVGHANLSLTSIKNFDIPMPPRSEQDRIVVKIEELFTQLDAGVAELQKAKAQLKRYRQAVLKAAVEGELTCEWREAHKDELKSASDLLERIHAERRAKWEEEGKKGKYKEPAAPDTDDLTNLPEKWVWATIEQIKSFESRSIQSGPFGSSLLHSEFRDTGILAIGIDNVLNGKFSMGKQHRISPKKYEQLKKFTARPLDVLITVMATIGRCCVLPADLETAIITKHVYRISVNQEILDPNFLMYCLLGESTTRKQIFGGVRGQTRPGINKSVLVKLPVPIPPLQEQQHIVDEIEQRLSVTDEIERELDQALARAERLRQSILKRAFEGKLVEQDPNDEPALVLLERIKTGNISSKVDAEKDTKKNVKHSKPEQLGLFDRKFR